MILRLFKKSSSVDQPRHLTVGRAGEEAACRALWRDGYRILERNFKRSEGEIDIIAEKDRVIYFIEVKTRTEADDPSAAVEAVDQTRRTRIRNAARVYLKAFDTAGLDTRYKVITISVDKALKPLDVRLFED
jgi:putative endonuclease